MSSARTGNSPQALGSLTLGLPKAPISEREEVARRVNEALTRLDLILSLLEKLTQSLVPSPEDADLRHGCERAMTSILSAVAAIEPAELSAAPPGNEEQTAKARFEEERLFLLIDKDKFLYLWSFVVRLLP